MLPNTVLAHLGQHLRAHYEAPNASIAPARLTRLLDRLVATLAGQDEALTAEVRSGLLAAVPNLRAYAFSLARDRDRADDLVQETLLKGWQHRGRYEPGTNLEGWLTTILRNSFVGVHRKRAWEVEDPNEAHAAGLSVLPEQEARLEMQDMQAALECLPPEQREALLLVAVNGMSSEAVAELTGCAVGTVKSRVWRARSKLAEILT
jgi:RNA polymerase sigma-70 factor (ECF subfamily)